MTERNRCDAVAAQCDASATGDSVGRTWFRVLTRWHGGCTTPSRSRQRVGLQREGRKFWTERTLRQRDRRTPTRVGRREERRGVASWLRAPYQTTRGSPTAPCRYASRETSQTGEPVA